MLKNPKRSSLSVFFRHCETFFQNFFFIKVVPIHQYFEILKSFCYFWALDMAPTWAVPGLFLVTYNTGWDFSYFEFVSTLCDIFRKKIPKGSPLNIFWRFATEWMLNNPKGAPFSFLALWDFFSFKKIYRRIPNSPILWHFEVLLLFLSPRYGTDLSRSRLVLTRSTRCKKKLLFHILNYAWITMFHLGSLWMYTF